MNINDHKVSITLGLLSAACAAFLPFFPHVSAGLAASIMGFIGTATTILKTYSPPPSAK